LSVGSWTAAALQEQRRTPAPGLRELALPKPERCAARAQRQVEAQFWIERDNP